MINTTVSVTSYPPQLLADLDARTPEAVAELQRFAYNLIVPARTRLVKQADAAAGPLLMVMVGVGVLLLAYQAWKGRLWLLRRRSIGTRTYWVWHASHGFLLLETVCCAMFFAKRRLQLHRDNDALPHPQNFAFIDVIALGAYWSGVLSLTMASFIACEGASPHPHPGNKRPLMHPLIINGITFGAPLVMGASLVTPIIFSRRAMANAVESYYALVSMDAQTSTSALLAQSSRLWSEVRQSVFHLGVCYAIFAAFEVALLFGLVTAAYKIVRLQRAQVDMAKMRLNMSAGPERRHASSAEGQRLSNRRRQLLMSAAFFASLFLGECLFVSISLYNALCAQRGYARGPREGTRVIIFTDLAVGWSMVVLATLTFAVSTLRVLAVVEKTDKARQSATEGSMVTTAAMPLTPTSPTWHVPHLSKRLTVIDIEVGDEQASDDKDKDPHLELTQAYGHAL